MNKVRVCDVNQFIKQGTRIRVFIFLLFIFFQISFISCTSSKLSSRKIEIKNKIDIAVKNAEPRSEENKKQYIEVLIRNKEINEYSEDIINTLLNDDFIEADINKITGKEIEIILVPEILHKQFVLFETRAKRIVVDGVIYIEHYPCDNKNLPSFYTEVYVYDSNREKIREFYKVNYDLFDDKQIAQYPLLQLEPTAYTKQKEELLLKKGYIKVSEVQFDGINLFKEIYKKVYGEEYTKLVPDYCLNNFLLEGIYYQMLNSLKYSSEPFLMTYVILQEKDKKYYYYKLNYNLEYEIYYWTPEYPLEKEEMKIFY